jgi:hypothetical protein
MKYILSLTSTILFFLVFSSHELFPQSTNNNSKSVQSYISGEYYVESFEEKTFPPAGWEIRNVLGANQWERNSQESFIGGSSAFLSYEFQGDMIGTDWLITPRYSVNLDDSLSFYIHPVTAGMAPDTLKILVSMLEHVPLENAYLENAFTDTLLVIQVDHLSDKWFRYSASLNKYNGKQIYIGFRDFNINGSGLYLDQVKMGEPPSSDISFLSAEINNYPIVGHAFHASACYINNGYESKTFDINCKINGTEFFEQKTFTDVKPDSVVEADFDAWVPTNSGTYKIVFTSELSGDEVTDNNEFNSDLHVLDYLIEAQWRSETDMTVGRYSHGVIAYKKESLDEFSSDTSFIYVIGGRDVNSFYTDSIMRYNAITRTWSAGINNLPEMLDEFCSVQIEGKIYIIGSEDVKGDVNPYVYIYDINSDNWSRGADMLKAVKGCSSGVVGDSLIYLVGGINAFNEAQNSVQIYNIRTKKWRYGTSVKYGGQFSGSISGNKIVVTGNVNEEGDYRYATYAGNIDPLNPYNITWSEIYFPGGKILNLSSGSWHGKNKRYIFFTGGYDESSNLSLKTWAYDVVNDSWLAGPDKISSANWSGNFTPVVRNDSVFMASLGGVDELGGKSYNEWLYIAFDDELTKVGRDVAVISANIPDTVVVRTMEIPKAAFINKQLTARNFSVTMQITPGDYLSTKEINSLAYECIKEIEFDPWIPAIKGNYKVSVYSSLAGDEDKTNDTLWSEVNVSNALPGSPWHLEEDVPDGRVDHGSVFYLRRDMEPNIPDTGYVFLIAGRDNNILPVDNILKYNSVSKNWSSVKSHLPISIYGIKTVQIGGKIYIPGGQKGTFHTSSALFIYDIEADTIGRGADLLESCSGYAIGTYGDSLIYVMGGNKTIPNSITEFIKTVQIYNIHTDTWKYGTTISGDSKGEIVGSICGNRIVLTGATTSKATLTEVNIGIIDPSDPYKIKWRIGEDYPSANYYRMASCSWYGKDKKYVFFSGGMKDENGYNICKSETWAYNVENNNWIKYPNKIFPVGSASMSVVERNDSVFMVVSGGRMEGASIDYFANEWLYISPNNRVTIDVAVKSIFPADTIYIKETVAPKAFFVNNLSGKQTFESIIEIAPGGYKDIDTVTSLAGNSIKEVDFKDWIPDSAGTYMLKVYTNLPSDEDRMNDTLSIAISVLDTSSIGIKETNVIPYIYSLSQNYPNPFNPATRIQYSVANAGMVTLKVYNMLGQEVKTLVNEEKSAGIYEVTFNAAGLSLASGVYIYRIKAGDFVKVKKLMLIK